MSDARPDPLRAHLAAVIPSGALVVAVAVVFAAVHHDDWNTWLFVWGLAIGLTGLLQSELATQLAVRMLGSADPRTAPERLRFRRRFNAFSMPLVGLVIGLIAGAGNLLWVDLVMTGIALVVWIPTSFIAMRVIRRARPTT